MAATPAELTIGGDRNSVCSVERRERRDRETSEKSDETSTSLEVAVDVCCIVLLLLLA